MAGTTKVTLGGTEYEVPKLNIGQLERVVELPGLRVVIGTIRIALERATPKVADFNKVEPDNDEIKATYNAILVLCGLKPVPEKNVAAPAAASGEVS